MKTCFFIGHREADEALLPALHQTIERHITEYGVTDFVVGRKGGFDRVASRAVRDVKERRPEIRLTLLLPYHPVERAALNTDGFDALFYPPNMETVPKRLSIVRANRYMVDISQFLIAYVCRPASNAHKLLEYARKREARGLLRVENLADLSDKK